MALASCFSLLWLVWIIHRSEAWGRAKVERALQTNKTTTNIYVKCVLFTHQDITKIIGTWITCYQCNHDSIWLHAQTIAIDIGDEKLQMNSCQLAVSCSYLEANFWPHFKKYPTMEFAAVSAQDTTTHTVHVSHSVINKYTNSKPNSLTIFRHGSDHVDSSSKRVFCRHNY